MTLDNYRFILTSAGHRKGKFELSKPKSIWSLCSQFISQFILRNLLCESESLHLEVSEFAVKRSNIVTN